MIQGLHLTVLWAAAFAQPLFEVLGGNAAFFAIRGSEPIDIVVFAVALVTVVPFALLALETLAALVDAGLSRALHLCFVAALAALFALQALDGIAPGADGALLIAIAAAIGLALAAAYRRIPGLRQFLTVVSPAALVFLVAFLVFSPVNKLVFGGDDDVGIASVTARAPVVMIVFDQFPTASLMAADGGIDRERYPNFAAFAKDAYWFRNAAATSDLTELAVPAILTGKRPGPSDLPLLRDHPRSLFTLFGRSHTLSATESTTHLCPQELCDVRVPGFGGRMRSLASDLSVVAQHMVLPADLRGGLPSVAYKWQDFGDDAADAGDGPTPLERLADAQRAFVNRREIFTRFVDSIGPTAGGRPPLHFIHSMVPHYPFEYLPSGRSYGKVDVLPGIDDELRWGDDAEAVARGYQRHLLQVAFVDRMLGRLLRRLRATGMYEDSLIVVTADHGATFRPGRPLLGWSGDESPDILPVPLLIKAPGARPGRTVDAHIQTVDILPTVAGLLRVRIPWEVDGRSALAPGADRRSGLLHHPNEEPRGFSFRLFDAALRDALRHKTSLFGSGNGFSGIYGIGPRPELLGRELSDFPIRAAGELRANLDPPLAVDLRSTFVPAHVTGELLGPGAGTPTDVAIAVNGRIAAVTRSAPVPGAETLRFSAIVPERSFVQGANRIQVLAVSSQAGAISLTPLASARPAAAGFSLVGGEIRSPGTAPIRIVDGTFKGLVDQVLAQANTTRFGGWALRRRDRRSVERILAFAGARLVHAGKPELERPDVAREYGTSARRLGFGFVLDNGVLGEGEVRVFAVSGRTAARLPYLCGPRVSGVGGC